MTWFVSAGSPGYEDGYLTAYTDGQKKKTSFLTYKYKGQPGPFPAEWRDRVPPGAQFGIKPTSGPVHIICHTVGYIFFSEPAFAVLKALQTEGFEAFPLVASTFDGMDHMLQSEVYYLVHPFREFSIIDIEQSSFVWPNDDRKKCPTFGKENERRIVLQAGLQLPDFCADKRLYYSSFFLFSDRLKETLCDIGTNPNIFEACQSAAGG